MEKKRFRKIKYVETVGPTVVGTAKYFFPQLADINDALIYRFRTWCVEDVTKTQSGNTPLKTASMQCCYLTLYFDGGEFVVVPALELVTVRNSSTTNHPFATFEFKLEGQVVVWTKSFITISDAAGITAGNWFHCDIDYVDPPKKDQY